MDRQSSSDCFIERHRGKNKSCTISVFNTFQLSNNNSIISVFPYKHLMCQFSTLTLVDLLQVAWAPLAYVMLPLRHLRGVAFTAECCKVLSCTINSSRYWVISKSTFLWLMLYIWFVHSGCAGRLSWFRITTPMQLQIGHRIFYLFIYFSSLHQQAVSCADEAFWLSGHQCFREWKCSRLDDCC